MKDEEQGNEEYIIKSQGLNERVGGGGGEEGEGRDVRARESEREREREREGERHIFCNVNRQNTLK